MIWRLLGTLALIGMLGCAGTWWGGKTSKTISFGMPKEEVQQLYGPPQQVTTQHIQGRTLEIWKYGGRSVIFRDGTALTWDLPADQVHSYAEDSGP